MEQYNVCGDFGKVAFFDYLVPSDCFSSLDAVTHSGWHRVNDLYHVERPKGVRSALILFTRAGNGFVRIGQKKYAAVPGSVILIPPMMPNEYGAESDSIWDFYWIHFRGEFSFGVIRDMIREERNFFLIGTSRIETLFRPFAEGFRNPGHEIVQAEALHTLLFALLKECLPKRNSEEQKEINEMISFLEKRKDEFSLEEMALYFHYSKEHLIRKFKIVTGMSPYRYWRLRRLRQSCVDLGNARLSISEIAVRCGYRSVGSYSKEFSKTFFLSPEEYRKMIFAQN